METSFTVMQSGIIDRTQKAALLAVTPPRESAPGESDEGRLVRAAQSGDQAAMQTLLARHESSLLSVCRGILGDATEAEDAVQEAFLHALRVFAKPNGYRGQAAFRTWLLRIGIHVCLDWRRKRRTTVSLQDVPVEAASAFQNGPEPTLLMRLRVQEAMAVLPPRHRALLILREQDGYSVSEIADILHWNPKKVHNELFKARQTLLRWREREEK